MSSRRLGALVAVAALAGLTGFGGGVDYSPEIRAKVNRRGRKRKCAHKPKNRKKPTTKKQLALKSRKINRGVW